MVDIMDFPLGIAEFAGAGAQLVGGLEHLQVLGAGEQPAASTLTGGILVLGALIANEALAMLGRDASGQPQAAPRS